MSKFLITLAVCSLIVCVPAAAQPVELNFVQLDQVTSGCGFLVLNIPPGAILDINFPINTGTTTINFAVSIPSAAVLIPHRE
jgi:hypothetical protein